MYYRAPKLKRWKLFRVHSRFHEWGTHPISTPFRFKSDKYRQKGIPQKTLIFCGIRMVLWKINSYFFEFCFTSGRSRTLDSFCAGNRRKSRLRPYFCGFFNGHEYSIFRREMQGEKRGVPTIYPQWDKIHL